MRYFQSIILFCLMIVTYALSPEMEEEIRQVLKVFEKECRLEIGASDDDIAPLKKGELPATQTGKCFLACMNKKFEVQDKSGKINKAKAYSELEKLKPYDYELYSKLKLVTDVCFAEVTNGEDECETAYNMMSCWNREGEKVGLESIDY